MTHASHFSGSISCHIFKSWRWEQLWRELASSGHVTLDFHLSLHEGDLWVECSLADLLEVAIGHGEDGIWVFGLLLFNVSLTVFEVNGVDKCWLSTLLFGDLEAKNGLDLWDKVLALTPVEEFLHHGENLLRHEA